MKTIHKTRFALFGGLLLAALPMLGHAQSIGGSYTIHGHGYTTDQAWQNLIDQANQLCTFGFPGVQSFSYSQSGPYWIVTGQVTCNRPGLAPTLPGDPGIIG